MVPKRLSGHLANLNQINPVELLVWTARRSLDLRPGTRPRNHSLPQDALAPAAVTERCDIKTCAPSRYSSGSNLMIVAPRLFPTQNVGGLVELSTYTRRTLVVRGRRYSVTSFVLVFTRTM